MRAIRSSREPSNVRVKMRLYDPELFLEAYPSEDIDFSDLHGLF
jgi:hypothetical protein